jgi:hypothetical protein
VLPLNKREFDLQDKLGQGSDVVARDVHAIIASCLEFKAAGSNSNSSSSFLDGLVDILMRWDKRDLTCRPCI